MIQQNDTIRQTSNTLEAQKASGAHRSGYHSPQEILSWLPPTATPWQQDSMLRAHYKFPEVDWSKRPNPLCTPGTKADSTSGFTLDKPMYYSHSLVQKDSIYLPERAVYRQGVAGDPVPYTIAGDNLITSILLGCFIFAAIAISKSGNFLQRQIKNFFHVQREGTTVITETGSELRFQFFLVVQTSLLFALVFFLYTRTFTGASSVLPNYQIIGIFTGVFIVYFLLKMMLYGIVNWVFFDRKKNEQWSKAFLFLMSTEGLAIFPLVMLLAYFNFSIHSATIYVGTVVVLFKILTFYKAYLIFFRRNQGFLQSFLYFCALELMFLTGLWGLLMLVDNYLQIKF